MDDGHSISDKLVIANKFNIFFTNVGPDLARKINCPVGCTFTKYLTKRHNHFFKFKNIHENDIEKIIDNLQPKNSSGHDGISTKLLKQMKNSLIKPITLVVNQSLKTGIFPDSLKIAKVIPLFKVDDDTLFNNYRPISILPAISKIFEKIMFIQTYVFFQEFRLFCNSQYGFRTGHSTEFATLELVDNIINRH